MFSFLFIRHPFSFGLVLRSTFCNAILLREKYRNIESTLYGAQFCTCLSGNYVSDYTKLSKVMFIIDHWWSTIMSTACNLLWLSITSLADHSRGQGSYDPRGVVWNCSLSQTETVRLLLEGYYSIYALTLCGNRQKSETVSFIDSV
jgi:hypothetical protein